MNETYKMLINGRHCDAASGNTLAIINPSTGREMARAPAGDERDVELAVAAAKNAFLNGPWPRLSPWDRASLINKLADLIEGKSGEIAELEASNNGRPVAETMAQVSLVPRFLRYNASLALTFKGETTPIGEGYFQYLHYAPIGVVAVMAPFNHPMLIAARGIAPALAAGNTVVLKPSELTPITSFLLGDLALAAGIPAGVVNVVNGLGITAGQALSQHPDIARIEFTGGTDTGRKVAVAAAERFGRVTAELGGKSPVLVFEDADINNAATGEAFAGFIAAGQSCVAGSRVLVHESIVDAFSKRLTEIADSIVLGDPTDGKTQMGPVISQSAKNRITDSIALAERQGGRVLTRRRHVKLEGKHSDGFWVAPTVMRIDNNAPISKQEIFGPVVTVESFSHENEALARANDSEYGLGAAVWTTDVARAHRVAQAIEAGMIWVNDHHRLSPAMPWGGFKQSGIGKQAGEDSFRAFSQQRSIIIRTAPGAPTWFTDGSESRLN